MFYMLLFLLLFLLSVFFVSRVCIFLSYFISLIRLLHGFVSDIKVDEIFHKATLLGALHSYEKEYTPAKRLQVAYEHAASIATDVLLQNGFDPRHYNLQALILISRVRLGLTAVPKGVDSIGKS
jgi:hypothetical protein